MNISNEFFTLASFGTFAGMLTIVIVICNTIHSAFDYMSKWLVLVISLVISLIAVFLTEPINNFDYVIGVLNGCLLFITSIGGNQLINFKSPIVEEIIDSEAYNGKYKKMRVLFFSNWFTN